MANDLITESPFRMLLRIVIPAVGRNSGTFIAVGAIAFFCVYAVHALTPQNSGGVAIYALLMTLLIRLCTFCLLPETYVGRNRMPKVELYCRLLPAVTCSLFCPYLGAFLPSGIPMASAIALTMVIYVFFVITHLLINISKIRKLKRLQRDEMNLTECNPYIQ